VFECSPGSWARCASSSSIMVWRPPLCLFARHHLCECLLACQSVRRVSTCKAVRKRAANARICKEGLALVKNADWHAAECAVPRQRF
jgi:hypothetical protein